jgi:hypothetical protein
MLASILNFQIGTWLDSLRWGGRYFFQFQISKVLLHHLLFAIHLVRIKTLLLISLGVNARKN